MGYVIALFAVLARLSRPTCGVHVTPFGYLRELSAELRRRRSGRVRRYVAEGHTSEAPAPLVPAPRKPADGRPRTVLSSLAPVVEPREAEAPAALVRGYYVTHERREALRRAGRNPLGATVLCDITEGAVA
ncbi:hypothetical protein [Nocardiopsis kunsanensis]|uniref:hypothetical protein n=1 Tax=Nocardiopsis kunsanensis TaxID=141693 RepID=UPI000A05A37F|nr:hypothetical protein [Nocardiopsis kunsanensis]